MYPIKFSMECTKFQQIIRFLKEITDEAKFNFDNDGLHVCVMDSANVTMAELHIPKSEFETYEFTELVKVGVDFTMLGCHGILSEMPVGIFEFSLLEYNENPNPNHKLEIINSIFKNTMKMITVDSIRKEPKVPNYEVDTSFNMDTEQLQNIVRRAKLLSEFIIIETVLDENIIRFVSSNDDDVCCAEVNQKLIKSGNSTAMYGLDYFDDMVKPIKSNTVLIGYKSDWPLTLVFSIGKKGRCKYLLAPRIKEE